MTAVLTTHDVEPSDGTSWVTADGLDAFVRADDAAWSKGRERWYHLKRSGTGWELRPPRQHWDDIETPEGDPSMWPLTEGPSDLHDLVMREVCR